MPALRPTGIITDTLILICIARTRMQVDRSSAAPATPPDHRLASA
jgi:hypothetical protein